MVTPGTSSGSFRGQHRHAADAAALLAGLQHAAHDHVLDQRRVGAAAVDQCVEHLCRQIHRMPTGHTPALAAAGSAGGGDDISFSHDAFPFEESRSFRAQNVKAQHSASRAPMNRRASDTFRLRQPP
jgi:hypothetical protein